MIRKIILIALALVFGKPVYSVNYDGEDSVYYLAKYFGEEYSVELKKSTTAGLSSNAILLRELAIKVLADPSIIKNQISFLNNFPNNYQGFTSMFQEYEGVKSTSLVENNFIYIKFLNKLSLKYPEKGALIYVGISKEACFSADLLNYFRDGLKDFIRHYNYYFELEKNKLSDTEIININNFLKAKLYGDLSCKDRV